MDECSSNPCQNLGTCSDGIDSFSCICLSEFEGSLCETNIVTTSVDETTSGFTTQETTESELTTIDITTTDMISDSDTTLVPHTNYYTTPSVVDASHSDTTTIVATTEYESTSDSTTYSHTTDDASPSSSPTPSASPDSIDSTTATTSPDPLDGTSPTTATDSVETPTTSLDGCLSSPCYNFGTCAPGINSYTCFCLTGYEGLQCQIGK